jgi:hypothetical protein
MICKVQSIYSRKWLFAHPEDLFNSGWNVRVIENIGTFLLKGALQLYILGCLVV